MSNDFFYGHEVDEVLGFFILKKPIEKIALNLSLDFYKKLRPFVGIRNYNIRLNYIDRTIPNFIIGSAYIIEQTGVDDRIVTLNTRSNHNGYYGHNDAFKEGLKVKQYNVQPGFGKFVENFDAEIYNLMLVPSLDIYNFGVRPYFLIEMFLSIFSKPVNETANTIKTRDSFRNLFQDEIKYLNDMVNSLSNNVSITIPIDETTKFYRFLCFLSGSLNNLALNTDVVSDFLEKIDIIDSKCISRFNKILEISIIYQHQILNELHDEHSKKNCLYNPIKSEFDYINFFKWTL